MHVLESATELWNRNIWGEGIAKLCFKTHPRRVSGSGGLAGHAHGGVAAAGPSPWGASPLGPAPAASSSSFPQNLVHSLHTARGQCLLNDSAEL